MHSAGRSQSKKQCNIEQDCARNLVETYRRGQLSPFRNDDEESDENWMSRVDDDQLVSSLTIPGTHDSAAYTSRWPFVATQRMNTRQQLNAGIRYFDFRCGIRDDIVEMVHGRAYLGLQLSEVLEHIYSWFKDHPHEGLIVQIKKDRPSQRATIDFQQAIYRLISAKPERWRTANTTPSMGDLRGKIQLFRRYGVPYPSAFGIDVTRWKDNPTVPFTIYTRHNVKITIQDHYNFPKPTSLPKVFTTKGNDVAQLLSRASQDKYSTHWYMNFVSAFEFNFLYQIPPVEIALGGYWGFKWHEGMNSRLKELLNAPKGDYRFGIVAMDFPETGADDLISTLIKWNFQKQSTGKRKTLLNILLTMGLVAIIAALRLQPDIWSVAQCITLFEFNACG